MKFKSLTIIVHVFKGIDGHKLASMYVNALLGLLRAKNVTVNLYVFCYGFKKNDEFEVKSAFAKINQYVEGVNFEFQGLVYSEVPTLKKAISLSKSMAPDDLIVYLHSKGASYKNQTFFVNWAMYATAALAAAVDHTLMYPKLIDRYHSMGSFAGLGVFERYGTMSPAFSGNFWLTTAKNLVKKDFDKKWYSDAYHNRHFAEALLGLDAAPGSLLNLEDNYNLRATAKPNETNIYERVIQELHLLSCATEERLSFVDAYVESFYGHLIEQQKRYSESRFFWKLRRVVFGNKSVLRYSPFASKALDRIVPWSQSELYRNYTGPKQFDVLNNYISIPVPVNEEN